MNSGGQQEEKSGGRQGDSAREGARGQEERQSLPEKVTLFVSIAIVLGLIGYIGWYGLFLEKGTPMVAVRALVEKARERDGRWVIPVEVKNVSDRPLEDVQVKVEVTTAEGESVDIDLTFPYLAERGTETAAIVTDLEPEKASPEPIVQSFMQGKNARGY